jgi:thiamine-phosphate pyrophosphorylase
MKEASESDVEKVALEALSICEDHGALLIINDYLDVALKVGAGGVHLGKSDTNWKAARNLAGPDLVIGGTVNSLSDAREALASQSLDYVGVGPLRHTTTKKNLAPVLEAKAFSELLQFLGELPKVVIGGVLPEDLIAISSMDAEGVAISSGLFREGSVSENLNNYLEQWPDEG